MKGWFRLFNKNQKENFNETLSQLTIPAFGYELIRDAFMKDLLGKDYKSILYWGGKNLARKYPLGSLLEVIDFFKSAGMGNLSIAKENKNELILELTSELITNRFDREADYSYQLEAGFLAEQIQNIIGKEAEAIEQQKKKTNSVLFTVQWE